MLSVDEVKSMLASTNNMLHKSAMGIIYDAALRVGEIASLHVSEIDFHREVIYVRQGK